MRLMRCGRTGGADGPEPDRQELGRTVERGVAQQLVGGSRDGQLRLADYRDDVRGERTSGERADSQCCG